MAYIKLNQRCEKCPACKNAQKHEKAKAILSKSFTRHDRTAFNTNRRLHPCMAKKEDRLVVIE